MGRQPGEDVGTGLVGLRGTAQLVVTEEDTAEAFGSGDLPVFATPRLIAVMERAACDALSGHLADGVTTVGVHLDVRHTAPSPIGALVVATAEVRSAAGNRIEFDVRAIQQQDGQDAPIGAGTHVRVAVDAAGFVASLDAQG